MLRMALQSAASGDPAIHFYADPSQSIERALLTLDNFESICRACPRWYNAKIRVCPSSSSLASSCVRTILSSISSNFTKCIKLKYPSTLQPLPCLKVTTGLSYLKIWKGRAGVSHSMRNTEMLMIGDVLVVQFLVYA